MPVQLLWLPQPAAAVLGRQLLAAHLLQGSPLVGHQPPKPRLRLVPSSPLPLDLPQELGLPLPHPAGLGKGWQPLPPPLLLS